MKLRFGASAAEHCVSSFQPLRMRFLSRVALCIALVACGGAESSGPPSTLESPGLRVTGASLTDTVDAMLPRALFAHVVASDGKPASGIDVTFTATRRSPNAVTPIAPTLVMSMSATGSFSSPVVATTNAQGDASVFVRTGTVAGTGTVVITVPTLGLTDTAKYTVQPGSVSAVSVAPADTAVFVGGSVMLRANAVDRHGNPRADAVTISVSRAIASVQAATITGTTIGRARVTATAGALSDTAGLSIVPHGTLVAQSIMLGSAIELALYTFDLDGTNVRKVVTSVVAGTGFFGDLVPVWSADGKFIFYHDDKLDQTRALWVYDVASGTTRRLTSGATALNHEAWPAVSRDGQWVYYNGSELGGSTLYRIAPVGTNREQPGPSGLRTPSLSPEGTRVAAVNPASPSGGTGPIVVFDIASKRVTPLGVNAQSVAWSPVDERIAYITDFGTALRMIYADGSGDRSLTSSVGFTGRVSWSPDGKYVVAHGLNTLTIVDVSTGESIPVPLSFKAAPFGFANPSWKP